jgi:hypothetical protein
LYRKIEYPGNEFPKHFHIQYKKLRDLFATYELRTNSRMEDPRHESQVRGGHKTSTTRAAHANAWVVFAFLVNLGEVT